MHRHTQNGIRSAKKIKMEIKNKTKEQENKDNVWRYIWLSFDEFFFYFRTSFIFYAIYVL